MCDTSLWTSVHACLERQFMLDQLPERVLYRHHRTGVVGFFALHSLPYFPQPPHAVHGLLGLAGASSSQLTMLNRWQRAGQPSGVLLHVGVDQWYYWRASGLEGWPEAARRWPTDDAIGRANGKWERGALDETLPQCLISPDGYPF